MSQGCVGVLLGHREGSMPDTESGVKFQRCWFYQLLSVSFCLFLFTSLYYVLVSCVLDDNECLNFSHGCVHVVTKKHCSVFESSPKRLHRFNRIHTKISTINPYLKLLSSSFSLPPQGAPAAGRLRPFLVLLGSHVRTPAPASAFARPTIERRVDIESSTRVGFVAGR